jgi:hypothetical protein
MSGGGIISLPRVWSVERFQEFGCPGAREGKGFECREPASREPDGEVAKD